MDIAGFVLAASEVIRLEEGTGFLCTVYNKSIDIHFFILVLDEAVKLFKKIHVNHLYLFTSLKAGTLRLLNGCRQVLLKTTEKSTFVKLEEECELPEFELSDKVKAAVSVSGPIEPFSRPVSLQLISYQGFITAVRDAVYGIYELDGKVILYTTFNVSRSHLIPLKVNAEVFVSNGHFISDYEGKKIIVCCGLSSVKSCNSSNEYEENSVCSPVDSFLAVFMHHYPMNIFDLLWLEKLCTRLNSKFSPLMICNSNLFSWNSEILKNILEVFACPAVETNCSLCEEFFSNPHTCSVMSEDVLPTGCIIPYISEVLEEAAERVVWTKTHKDWKICYAHNEVRSLLIGLLYLSKNGSFYIADRTCHLPVVFSKMCSKCCDEKNILCSFNDLNSKILIVVQNFDIIFENITCRNGEERSVEYLKTACCYLFPIASFSNKSAQISKSFSSLNCALQENIFKERYENESLNTELSSQETLPFRKQTVVQNSFHTVSNSTCNDSENPFQQFLVLHKMWKVQVKIPMCYEVLVLFVYNRVYETHSEEKTESFINDSFDFYKTNDDLEFTDLIDKMDNLFLESKSRLVHLLFDTPENTALLLPDHMYHIDLLKNCNIDNLFTHAEDKKNNFKQASIKVTFPENVIHNSDCVADYFPENYKVLEYCGIKDIIMKKQVPENKIIRAILIDKYYEEDSIYFNSSRQLSAEQKMTLCLVVKDCKSKDCLKVYIPFFPQSLFGFLPGVTLEMYRFLCFCSRKGYLYLKPSTSFGIQVIHFGNVFQMNESFQSSMQIQNKLFDESSVKMSNLSEIVTQTCFRCLCYVVKVVSAEMVLMCKICLKSIQDRCFCSHVYEVKTKICTIIDDGTRQALAYFDDKTAKHILKLSGNEWQNLISYVNETKTLLKYNYKMQMEEIETLPFMNQVFSMYCCSSLLCRQVLLECQLLPSSRFQKEQLSVWCNDIIESKTRNLIADLYMKLQNINQV